MPKQTAHIKNAEAAPSRHAEAIREHNERAFDPAEKPGGQRLVPFQADISALADYQDKVADAAKKTGLKPAATMAGAQANLTREMTRAHTINVGAGARLDPAKSVVAGGKTPAAPELADGVVDIA